MEGLLIRGSDGIVASEVSSSIKNKSLTYKQVKRAGDFMLLKQQDWVLNV